MAFLIHITIRKEMMIMKWDEFSRFYDDFYSFVIYQNNLRHKLNPKNRRKSDIMKYIAEANSTLEEQLALWEALQGEEFEKFQIFCDIQTGNYQTAQELGEELGLSSSTINKRLAAAGVPKFNNNESNPFGKRYIPDCIKGRLVEIITSK